MEAEGPATQTWVVLEGEELEVNRGLGAKASSSWMGSAVTHESLALPPTAFLGLVLHMAVTTGLFPSEDLGDSHSFGQTGTIHIKLFLFLPPFLGEQTLSFPSST